MTSHSHHRQRGMTMIEIMVVLAIMGSLMAVLLGGSLLKSNAARTREGAVEVMATLRAAYNMATMTGKHHRVVFNLEEQTYHIEVCLGKQTLKKGDEEEQVDQEELGKLRERMERPDTSDINQEIVQAASPEEATEAAAALAGLRLGTSRCQAAVNTISGQPSKTGNKHKLDIERGIRIQELSVQHLNEAVDEGIVTINFFPIGSAERAVVQVGNTSGEVFSILVYGLTSRVEFREGKVEVEDHMKLDAAGDEVDERE